MCFNIFLTISQRIYDRVGWTNSHRLCCYTLWYQNWKKITRFDVFVTIVWILTLDCFTLHCSWKLHDSLDVTRLFFKELYIGSQRVVAVVVVAVVFNRGNPTPASRLNLACTMAEATIRPQWVYWLSGSIFCRPSRLLRPSSISHMGSETRYVYVYVYVKFWLIF